MRPGAIKTDRLSRAEVTKLRLWLEANGLRHYVPYGARIIFTGNRLIVPTFDIERAWQRRKAWAKRRVIRDAQGNVTGLPVKVRTYRVRVPFEAIK